MTIVEMLNWDLLADLEAQNHEQMSLKELEKFHHQCETYATEHKVSVSRSALELLLEIYNGRPPREER